MKTIVITEDEFEILSEFIITDAEDMRDMAGAIEEEHSDSSNDDEGDELHEVVGGDIIDMSLNAQAERARLLKRELARRFKITP